MKHPLRLQFLFEKYLQNRCTQQELTELLDLFKMADTEEALTEQMKAVWEQMKKDELIYEVDWDGLYGKVMADIDTSAVPLWKKICTNRTWWYVAASVLFLTWSVSSFFFQKSEEPPYAFIEKSVSIADTAIVFLSDGSKVTLNSGSMLRYPQKFSGSIREVYLEGEGYFEIAKSSKAPFLVQSGTLRTKVLGTTFNLTAYAASKTIELVVLSGKVAVKEAHTDKEIILAREQGIQYDTNKKTFNRTVVSDLAKVTAWMNGKMVFDDTRLEDVAIRLSKRYGVNIVISNNELSDCRLTAVFENQSINEIMEVITYLTNAKYRKNGNTIEWHGEGRKGN